jgi:hypothetical protein
VIGALLFLPVALNGQGPSVSGRNGFAIWPVDTPDEAREECLGGEPWRRSPDATVQRFAREIIHATQPSVSVTDSGFNLAAPRVPLEHHGGLRETYGCWYVTSILNREGFPTAGTGYAGLGDERVLFLHVPNLIESDTYVSVGSGPEQVTGSDLLRYQADGSTLITVPATEDEPGHYFIGYTRGAGEVVDDPDSGVIPPPPDVDDLAEMPGPASLRRALSAERRCPRYSRATDPHRTVRQDVQSALINTDQTRERPIRSFGEGDLTIRLGEARIIWDFWRISERCTLTARIRTVGTPHGSNASVRVAMGSRSTSRGEGPIMLK